MPEAVLQVRNRLGLHARAAAKVVAIASCLDASIRVGLAGRQVDGRNIMALLTLGAAQGSELHIRTEGPDAEQALLALQQLFERHFEEDQFAADAGQPSD